MITSLSKRGSVLIRCVAVFIIGGWLWFPFSSLLSGTDTYLSKPLDDFFYYVRIAQHIIHSGIVSFDGITITNGFHPLWLAVITFIMFFTGSGPTFFIAIYLFCAIAAYTTFELLLQTGKNIGLPLWLNVSLSLVLFPHTTGIIFDMMEGVLAIPIILFVINYIIRIPTREPISARHSLILGMLSAALVLTRFETAIFIALLIVGWLIGSHVRIPEKIKTLALFCLGGTPLILFLLWNLIAIGNVFPVSVLAKSLGGRGSLAHNFFATAIQLKIFSDLLFTVVTPIALIVLFVRRKNFCALWNNADPKRLWYVITATIAFPLIFYTYLSFTSDWAAFPWYFYSVPIALFLSLWVIVVSFPIFPQRIRPNITRMALLAVLCYAIINPIYHVFKEKAMWVGSGGWGVYTQGKMLRTFITQHPGVYAMGDDAALTSYITDAPMIQLEGLVCDLRMVEHIKHQDRLNDVLAEYHVDYLVTTSEGNLPSLNNCYYDLEPHRRQAGSYSPVMQGIFCTQPVLDIASSENGRHMYVFPVSQEALTQADHATY